MSAFTESFATTNGTTELPQPKRRTKPLWSGPSSVDAMGGVTFSMLSKWLTCRARSKVYFIDGIRSRDRFSHRLSYGNMFHVCEEAHQGKRDWETALLNYAKELLKQYPMDRDEVEKWYAVCRCQFPVYIDFWKKHPDELVRKPLEQEKVFDVWYTLPNGRKVRLRGKRDAANKINGGNYLKENKTKGDIDVTAIQRQLTYDIQVMLYLIPMEIEYGSVAGVDYNVVRRPLSGGKGTIVQKKPSKSNPIGETADQYYDRLAQYIRDEPETYFMRWKTEIVASDILQFRIDTLDPILEQLCLWYDVVTGGKGWALPRWAVSWRHPYGVPNTISEYGIADIDAYMNTGNMAGLVEVDNLFGELQ